MLPDFYRPRTPPFAHQAEALELGWRRDGFAYLMEMGTGKSRTLIDDFCLNYLDERKVEGLLIIAPKGVYTNWTRMSEVRPGELQRWLWIGLVETAQIYAYAAGRSRKEQSARTALMDTIEDCPRILVVNAEALATTQDAYDLCVRFLRTHRTMIVVDESTLIKNHSSQRTKLCIALSRLAHKRRILTGAPTTGSLSDLWAQFEFLAPGSNLLGHPRFATFRARYCRLRDIVVSGRTIQVEVGPMNVEELAEIVAQHSYRKKKRDCLDLPPKDFRRWEVLLTDEQKRVYKELRTTAMAIIRDAQERDEGEVSTQIVLTQILRMHQVVCGHVRLDDGRVLRLESNRMAATEEIIAMTDEPTIVWTAYRPDADLVAARLRELYGEDSVAEWHGGKTMREREAGEEDFQAGRRRFMVATISAGARGRTWTAATLTIYYSNQDGLELRLQSEDRNHRIGTMGSVVYWDIVAPGTTDEKIINGLRAGQELSRAVLRDEWEAWI